MDEKQDIVMKYVGVTLQVCSGTVAEEELPKLREKQDELLHLLSFEESWRAFDIVHQTLSMRLDF